MPDGCAAPIRPPFGNLVSSDRGCGRSGHGACFSPREAARLRLCTKRALRAPGVFREDPRFGSLIQQRTRMLDFRVSELCDLPPL
jgi:hypothetical protein